MISYFSAALAETIAVWRCKCQLSQAQLGGRDGSNACTLIAIVSGRMFCLNEGQLSAGTSNPLKNSWFHAFANAIVDGNNV